MLVTDFLEREVRRVMGRPDNSRINVADGFFDLGLDSLMAVELRNEVERSLGVQVSPTVAFDYSSIEELAPYLCRMIERDGNGAAATSTNVRPSALPRSLAIAPPEDVLDAEHELRELERILATDERH
jgi:acyl carrier protein